MKRIDDLKHDVQDISDNVLGNLSTEERIRMFAREAADDNEERLDELAATAPEYEYTSPDLEYLNGIKKLGAVSLQARNELQTLYQAIHRHERHRNELVAVMLLNESLSRLSRGAFDIDEFGNFDAPGHDDAEYAYGRKSSPDTAFLATKYRDLWEDVPAGLLVDEDDRSGTTRLFPNLAAAGSLAYPDDLSGEEYADFEDDRTPSEVHETEVRLLITLVRFRTKFYGWQIFAEEYLDITLDELLAVSAPEGEDEPSPTGILPVKENLCENILSMKQDYIEAYPALLEESAHMVDGVDKEDTPDMEEIEATLDERARNYAEGMAEAVDLPGVAGDA